MFTVRYNATISPDHVRLTNIATGQTVARAAPRPFSSQHRMIANPEAAALFLGNLIREVEGRKRWLRSFALSPSQYPAGEQEWTGTRSSAFSSIKGSSESG